MKPDEGHAAGLAEMLEALGCDRRAFAELIELFVEHAPSLLTRLRTAVEMGDDWRVARIAHRLRGSLAHFSTREAAAALARLERRALAADLRGAPAELEVVEHALSSLIRAMRPYRA